ncbi:hypothetical protein E2K98_24710 [Bacillus salipaludis]|uniref:Type I restriction modification DNA specificity domain-containing protein n=1 Tax=Bacillus salipaludis TaxID=2547811 RepID=A0A4R5VK99_9BACI|nr:restriction endonuclease subunit S [Bacillus salipaludis]TDK58122.1 hypothetical protein E2K98_24710 [Bacillus salipaludis]
MKNTIEKIIFKLRQVTLKDISEEIQYGYTQSSSKKEIGPKFLRITDIQDNNVNWEETPYCEISDAETNKYKLFDGDIVVARTGATTGKSFLIKSPPESVFASYLIRIKPNKNLVLPRYLWTFMQSRSYWNQINTVSNGSTQPGVNASVLSKLKIPLPSLNIQKIIADVFTELEILIQKRKEVITKMDELVRSVFLEMFGEPTANQHNFEKTNIETISSLVSSGSTPLGGKKVYKSEGILFIRSQNVLMNRIDYSDIVHIDDEVHKKMKRTWVKKNDVLINITGASIGRVAVYYGEDDNANVNQHVCIIRPKLNMLVPEFLSYFLSNDNYQKKILSQNAGATRQAFNFKQIKDFEIYLPPFELQKEFSNIICEINIQKKHLENQLSKLEEYRQSILHHAFTGELQFNETKVNDYAIKC